jgi:hypothetical protein
LLAPGRDRPGDGEVPALQVAQLLDAPPGLLGVAGAPRLRQHLPHRLVQPRRAAALVEPGRQPLVQLDEVGHVGCGVGELGVGEGSSEPVGEAVGLGQRHSELPLEEGGERRARVAEEPGGQLGVDEVPGDGAAAALEDLEVLSGGVHDGPARALEDLGEGMEVEGERVEEREAPGPGDLHQRELREVRALAVELGVHAVPVGSDELLDHLAQVAGVGDELGLSHAPVRSRSRALTRPTRPCLRRRW